MGPESVILLAISAWFLVAAAMLWGILRIARRHAVYNPPHATTPTPAPLPSRRKKPRTKPSRPVLTPAYRAAHHFAHR